MKRFEILERAKAAAGGYFWLPCPNCGRMFGGHESNDGEILWSETEPGRGRITCTDAECKQQVRDKNQKNPAAPTMAHQAEAIREG